METEDFGKLHASNKVNGPIDAFLLKEGANTVGRAVQEHRSMHEVFGDEYLGRLHFTIEVNKDQQGRIHYTLFDNDSLNGTLVSFQKTKVQKRLDSQDRVKVGKGDRIKAGNTYFEIEPPKPTKDAKNECDT